MKSHRFYHHYTCVPSFQQQSFKFALLTDTYKESRLYFLFVTFRGPISFPEQRV